MPPSPAQAPLPPNAIDYTQALFTKPSSWATAFAFSFQERHTASVSMDVSIAAVRLVALSSGGVSGGVILENSSSSVILPCVLDITPSSGSAVALLHFIRRQRTWAGLDV